MTETQEKFIKASIELETLKEAIKEKNKEIQALATEIGVNTYFQDPSDKTVFKIIVPTGTFVEFRPIGFIRTKRGDEKRGELSVKEAQEAGFTLESK